MRTRRSEAVTINRDTRGRRVEGLLHVGRNLSHQVEYRLEGLPLVLRLDRQQLLELERGIAEAKRRMADIDNGAEVQFPRTEKLEF